MSMQALSHCRRCKEELKVELPIGIRALKALSKPFIEKHKTTCGTDTCVLGAAPEESKPVQKTEEKAKPKPPVISTQATVNAGVLLDELKFVKDAVERRSTIPILADVMLVTTKAKDALMIIGTDLDVTNRSTISAITKTGISVCVPADALANVVKNLVAEYSRDAVINFGHEANEGENTLTISSGTSTTKLRASYTEDFPTLPDTSKGTLAVTLPLGGFKDMLRDVKVCTTKEATRFQLHAVLLAFDKKRLELATTDGHRMAIRAADLNKPSQRSKWNYLIAIDAVAQLLRLDSAETVEFSLIQKKGDKPTYAVFRSGYREVIARNVHADVNFPNYREVVANDLATSVIIAREPLLRALERVRQTSTHVERGACKLTTVMGKLVLETISSDGTSTEQLDGVLTGPPSWVGINRQYLVDLVKIMPTSDVRISMKKSEDQIQITPVGDGLTEYTYVVMPMRLS